MIPAGVLVLLIMASLALYWLPGGVHSDSTSLVEVGIFDTPGFAFGVAVTGTWPWWPMEIAGSG